MERDERKIRRKGSEWWDDKMNAVVEKRQAYGGWLQTATATAYESHRKSGSEKQVEVCQEKSKCMVEKKHV